jgi:hypothetical protein
MMRLYQQGLEEMEREAILKFTFHPTAAMRAQGRFCVRFEAYDEEGDPDWDSPAHIIPLFGRDHLVAEFCWCQPRKEFRDDGSHYFSHRSSQ